LGQSVSRSSVASFHALIAANKRNSAILVAVFCLFATAVALVLGLAILSLAAPEILLRLSWSEGIIFGVAVVGLCLLISTLAYFGGDRMVLGVSHARPVSHEDDPELYNVVEEMSIAAGTRMPKVFLIDDSAPNAFATGRDPEHASITVTSGLRSKLSRDELQGVVAHEMSHVRNYDTRLMLLLTVLIGTVVMLADFFWQALSFSSFSRGRGRRRHPEGTGGGGIIMLALLVAAVILGLIAPILAQLIQLAVSRQREYLADASAVELTRYPKGLADALRKISADTDVLEAANRGTAHLYIVNPIEKFAARSRSMFVSHPPIEDRIRRLEPLTS
jgi:heat shock protein HtpX